MQTQMRRAWCDAGLCAGMVIAGSARADTLVVVNSPRGVTVSTLVLTPAAANRKATLILIPGGNGWLDIDTATSEPRRLALNFLIRAHQGLVGLGFRTVIVDAPSDRQGDPGLDGFRSTLEHARDLAAVASAFSPPKCLYEIEFWGYKFCLVPNPDPWAGRPVAVVGMSAGAISAARAAFLPGGTERNPDVAGIGLIASVTQGTDAIQGAPLASIKQPVLFVHHVNDGCVAAKYRNATREAYNMMVAAVDVGFVEISGTPLGPPDTDDPDPPINPSPCGATDEAGYTLHGFSRAGAPVLHAIRQWAVTLKR